MNNDLEDLARLERARDSRSARLIAGALTPANVVLALMAYLSVKYSSTIAGAMAWWATALLLVIGPPYLILFRALRTGRVDDRQVVRGSQRPALMISAACAVTLALLVLYLISAPRPLVWLILAMICGLVVMAAVTHFWKASMHLAVGAGVVAVLSLENLMAGLVAAAALPILGWARWRDGRHSLMQLIGGAAIGACVAGLVYGLLK